MSALRARCRIRGGRRDELEVRGGTKVSANAVVRIQYLNAAGAWVNLIPVVTPAVDTSVMPAQACTGTTPARCASPAIYPAQIRAAFNTNNNVNSGGFTPDAR